MTESERELLRSGKFDQLVEQQRRIDAERDAEVGIYSGTSSNGHSEEGTRMDKLCAPSQQLHAC